MIHCFQIFSALMLTMLVPAGRAAGQELPKATRDSIDAVVAEAYRAASAGLPCKIKGRGKPKMLRWEQVDRCLNDAASRVDWKSLSSRLGGVLAATQGVTQAEFTAAVEASFSAGALAFEKIFIAKEDNILLPLTNSLLKFLPPDSLAGLPVTDKVGTEVGRFAGIYSFERSGGLATANKYRLTLFQYTDRNGNVQSSTDKLLLDAFGVPWNGARSQRGFRLPADRLALSP
jgi:hypothetical protein